MKTVSPASGILLGGFLAGFCDFITPSVQFVMKGGEWYQAWKGVASGIFGSAAREGGAGMVVVGMASHWFICIGAAAILYLVASRLKFIPRQWILLGIIHGIAVLLMMNYVILPLSAIGKSIYPLETIYVPMFWHIVLVGLPTAFFVARALPRRLTATADEGPLEEVARS